MKKDKNLTPNPKKNQSEETILEIKGMIKLVTRTLRYQYKYVPHPQGHKGKHEHNEDTSRGYKREKLELLEMKVKIPEIRNLLDKINSTIFISEEKISNCKDIEKEGT